MLNYEIVRNIIRRHEYGELFCSLQWADRVSLLWNVRYVPMTVLFHLKTHE